MSGNHLTNEFRYHKYEFKYKVWENFPQNFQRQIPAVG